MGKINILDDRLINRIAAGEVVENPASVIKELAENAIDAGSTSIAIEFSKGGTEYIRIVDNGCGMDEDDAKNAFIRHATSKISSTEDLESIATMGFRGEALASISEVAQVELTTSTGDVGTQIIMRGGKCELCRPLGFPRGTTIEVRNLFFNTPARKKFLKSVRQETNNILELCSKLILAHPEVSFRVINNGRTELKSEANGDILEAVCSIYGINTKDEVLEVKRSQGDIEITGYVCKPAFAQLNRRRQSFFVNGRYVKSPVIAAALDEAFKGKLMINKFPSAVLYIKMPYTDVDVNVHPQKTEVRFDNTRAVYNAVFEAVSVAISPDDVFPEMKLDKDNHNTEVVTVKAPEVTIEMTATFDEKPKTKITVDPLPQSTLPKTEKNVKFESNADPKPEIGVKVFDTVNLVCDKKDETVLIEPCENVNKDTNDSKAQVVEQKASEGHAVKTFHVSIPSKKTVKEACVGFEMKTPEQIKIEELVPRESTTGLDSEIEFSMCGVLWDTYIIVQCGDMCYMIDQHAAHERFLFDKYSEEFKSRRVVVQQLLIPSVVNAEPSVVDIIAENIDVFLQLGFDIDVFGSNSCIIRGVPSVVSDAPFEIVFDEIIRLISENKSALNVIDDLVCPQIMKSACKHAVKGNQKLSNAEIKFILKAIGSLDGLTCPHGRPIAITLTRKELEKRFGRIQ